MTKRERLYPEIKRLREDEGLLWREIGERVGVSLKAAHDYYHDPTGEKARQRKAKNNGTCTDCGGETKNSGSVIAPERCRECANPEWTRDGVLEALRDWGDDHGGIPPREVDARIGNEGHGRLPYWDTVRKFFGSWNAGLLTAGYEALHNDRRPETQASIEEAIRSGERIASIAARFGVTEQAIHKRCTSRGMRVSEMRRAA
jgi:hypothetical protein